MTKSILHIRLWFARLIGDILLKLRLNNLHFRNFSKRLELIVKIYGKQKEYAWDVETDWYIENNIPNPYDKK